MHEVGHECEHRVRRRGVAWCEAIRLCLVTRIERARDGSTAQLGQLAPRVTWSDEPPDRI